MGASICTLAVWGACDLIAIRSEMLFQQTRCCIHCNDEPGAPFGGNMAKAMRLVWRVSCWRDSKVRRWTAEYYEDTGNFQNEVVELNTEIWTEMVLLVSKIYYNAGVHA
jgi:hypothetical protein